MPLKMMLCSSQKVKQFMFINKQIQIQTNHAMHLGPTQPEPNCHSTWKLHLIRVGMIYVPPTTHVGKHLQSTSTSLIRTRKSSVQRLIVPIASLPQLAIWIQACGSRHLHLLSGLLRDIRSFASTTFLSLFFLHHINYLLPTKCALLDWIFHHAFCQLNFVKSICCVVFSNSESIMLLLFLTFMFLSVLPSQVVDLIMTIEHWCCPDLPIANDLGFASSPPISTKYVWHTSGEKAECLWNSWVLWSDPCSLHWKSTLSSTVCMAWIINWASLFQVSP